MLLEIFAFFLTTALFGEKDAGFDPPQGPALQATQLLESINPNSHAAEVQDTIQRAVELLSPQSPAGEKLTEFLANPDDASDLIQVREEVLQMLTFTPRHEAELPEGFPTYTPPGVIEVKVYPKHRRAIAQQFFTLFGHITSNKIAMTTPVRMEFDNDKNGKLKQESMAFYYGNPTIGSVGDQGNVQVVEQEGEMVVALGHRGARSQKVIVDAERRLLAWIEAHPEYQANGKLIVMGYNSPMVPAKSQFFETQLPVKKTTSK